MASVVASGATAVDAWSCGVTGTFDACRSSDAGGKGLPQIAHERAVSMLRLLHSRQRTVIPPLGCRGPRAAEAKISPPRALRHRGQTEREPCPGKSSPGKQFGWRRQFSWAGRWHGT